MPWRCTIRSNSTGSITVDRQVKLTSASTLFAARRAYRC
jgi:hypothetical protein